ncbi:MAG: TPM domain-containing protein [Candidatus Heimdallarchaeaceae archaeon]
MFKKFFITTVFILLACILPVAVQAEELSFPEPIGFVNDFENIIENDEDLEFMIYQFQQETSTEIVVVTVSDFGGTTIEAYAVKLFENWGIGTDEYDNGVLILVSSAQRESRIEVGYGLEGSLPDALTGRIQDNEMIPHFRSDNYTQGITGGVEAVMSATRGEYVMESKPVEEDSSEIIGFIAVLIFLILFYKFFGIFPSGPLIGGVSRSMGSRSTSGRSSGFRGFGGGRSGGGGSSRSW